MRIIVAVSIAATLLAGCADNAYKANMAAREHMAMFRYQSQGQATKAVMQAIEAITRPMEQQRARTTVSTSIDRLIAGAKVDNASLGTLLLAKVATSLTDNQSRVDLARARAEAVRYLQPIMEAIYRAEQERFGTPPTWEHVALKFMDNLPLMSTVAGMYGLGYQGLKAAGDHIPSALSGGDASLNIHGVQMQDSGGAGAMMGGQSASEVTPSTTTTTTTTYPPPEVAEPVIKAKDLF